MMNKAIRQRLNDINRLLAGKNLTERQHSIICNKLDRLIDYINGD